MATPPSPSSPKPISTISTTSASPPSKKPQPLPWTHQETVHLIQAYQEKWYSLKRGPLKSSQWEEVAVTVAARCGYDYLQPSKTAVQCRHKMEKLRQRYRSEKRRASFDGGVSYWQYYGLMDRLELGPLPISARPMASIPYDDERELDQGADKIVNDCIDDDDEDENYSKSQSISYILQRPAFVNRFSGEKNLIHGCNLGDENSGFFQKQRQEEGDDEGPRGREMILELAAEIKGFADRFVGMEGMKMEMMRETERCRLEMENRRIEMILHSQQKLVESIGKAFGSTKRVKIGRDS